MSPLGDCVSTISGEHFISRNVLAAIGQEAVVVAGAPWIAAGSSKKLSVNNLRSNILCKRHNEALSPLDDMAGRFVQALKGSFEDVHNKKSLSRRGQWFLFSGEELELWLLKTALGLFHSGNAAKGGLQLRNDQEIHPICCRILQGRQFPSPCGLYILDSAKPRPGRSDQVQFAPLSDDNDSRMIGLLFVYMSFEFKLLFDTNAIYGSNQFVGQTYRPDYLCIENQRRQHFIRLTWSTQSISRKQIVTATV